MRSIAVPPLDLLPADASLRALDRFLFGLGKKKRLLKLIEDVGKGYDRVVLDAPPASPAGAALLALWSGIEQRLSKAAKAG